MQKMLYKPCPSLLQGVTGGMGTVRLPFSVLTDELIGCTRGMVQVPNGKLKGWKSSKLLAGAEDSEDEDGNNSSSVSSPFSEYGL